MNYSATLKYMFNRLPMYQRIGGAAYKADLTNTQKLCDLLGRPEKKFKTIHVAGTNGKGSTSHLLASVMQEAGFKTGLYTSPHFIDFRERIKINGEMIPEEGVIEFIQTWKNDLEAINLSFFEMTIGMAFQYFADQNVDIAIIEVGLGGRLDSTNVIMPQLSVITNIGMDHTQFLGNSLKEIATEKAGIIKNSVPVVIGESQPEIQPVFSETASRKNSAFTYADQNWNVTPVKQGLEKTHTVDVLHNDKHFLSIDFPLAGNYQLNNLTTALEAIHVIKNSGIIISKKAIKRGVEKVTYNTGLKGRWQTLGTTPLIICDSGHNRDGIRKVVENIKAISFSKLHIVFGVVNDKHLEGVLSLLPKEATYYFCKANIPRGLPADNLKNAAQQFGLSGEVFSSVLSALETAKIRADAKDMIFIGGSTFVVAEVL